MLQTDKPQMIYAKLKKKYDKVTRPTGMQQIRDKKKYENLKGRTTGHRKTVAEHIQQLNTMVTRSYSFVRALIRTNGKMPCILLYDDEKLIDVNICAAQDRLF
ncbi:hypothetical protein ACJMK2_018996 [Sinanodonta woodiana]|uniref:Uncharacterized protein n=1 Tax=Sinanodonta woodiana TaxID=1069815 RepID=A0ABD3UJ36_SINWO